MLDLTVLISLGYTGLAKLSEGWWLWWLRSCLRGVTAAVFLEFLSHLKVNLQVFKCRGEQVTQAGPLLIWCFQILSTANKDDVYPSCTWKTHRPNRWLSKCIKTLLEFISESWEPHCQLEKFISCLFRVRKLTCREHNIHRHHLVDQGRESWAMRKKDLVYL